MGDSDHRAWLTLRDSEAHPRSQRRNGSLRRVHRADVSDQHHVLICAVSRADVEAIMT